MPLLPPTYHWHDGITPDSWSSCQLGSQDSPMTQGVPALNLLIRSLIRRTALRHASAMGGLGLVYVVVNHVTSAC